MNRILFLYVYIYLGSKNNGIFMEKKGEMAGEIKATG